MVWLRRTLLLMTVSAPWRVRRNQYSSLRLCWPPDDRPVQIVTLLPTVWATELCRQVAALAQAGFGQCPQRIRG